MKENIKHSCVCVLFNSVMGAFEPMKSVKIEAQMPIYIKRDRDVKQF